ncbi:hypothetical protein GGS26DRAFT_593616 [Hypomontagnella submonticulosa]|nr:hypothetical protein GGS26DRAFT_593616 [Hypomontagnella submonticulosa]
MAGLASQAGPDQDSPTWRYNCPFSTSECIRITCVVHGRPSAAESAALKSNKEGGYDLLNQGKLYELDNRAVHIRPQTNFSVLKSVMEPAETRALKIQREEDPAEQLFPCLPYNPFAAQLLPGKMPGKSISTLAEPSLIDAQDTREAAEFERGNVEEDFSHCRRNDEDFTKPPSWYVLQNGNRDEELELFVPGTGDFVDDIFDNEEDRYRALRAHDSQYGLAMSLQRHRPAPLVFTYGIRYAPEPFPSPIESRMVLITGLPSYTPISEIMARVRGGQILRVATANSPFPVGFTVIIHFTEHENAKSYADYMGKNAPILFAPGVSVILGNSHSYPASPETEDDLEQGFTRLLSLGGFFNRCPKEFLDSLESTYLQSPEEVLEDLWLDKYSVLFILFKNVQNASRYYKTVIWEQTRSNPGAFYRDMHRFVRDPCDQPLDDLQGPIRLARDPYPSLLETWIEDRNKEKIQTVTTRTISVPSIVVHTSADEALKLGEGSKELELPSDKFLREFAESNGLTHLNVHERFSEYQSRYISSIQPGKRNGPVFGGNMTLEPGMDIGAQYWKDHGNPNPRYDDPRIHDDHGDNSKGKEPMENTGSPTGAKATLESPASKSGSEAALVPKQSSQSTTRSPYSGGLFPSSLDDGDDTLVPKYMLPQNDPAYFELLNRDHSDLVRRSEANAIWCSQEAKPIPKEEMRARYSAFFPIREQMAAWKSGYEYDPNAPGMREAEQAAAAKRGDRDADTKK